jgi:hypothetical protein
MLKYVLIRMRNLNYHILCKHTHTHTLCISNLFILRHCNNFTSLVALFLRIAIYFHYRTQTHILHNIDRNGDN